MKKNPIFIAISKRKVTFFITFLIILSGIFSYKVIPKQEIPDVSSPAAVITTIYPGASSSEIEELVTTPIEDEVSSIGGIIKLESTSKTNLSVVTVEFDVDIDADKAFTDLRRKVDNVQGDLPEGVLESEIDTDLTETPGVILAFSGNHYTKEQLEDYAEYFKRRLAVIDGVQKIEIEGKPKKRIVVEVDHQSLKTYQLSLDDILTRLKGQNINISSGEIGEGSNTINVKTEGLFESLDEIKNTIIDVSQGSGSVLRIRDIGKVYFEENERNLRARHNGKDALLLAIYLQKAQNNVEIGEVIEKRLTSIQEVVPSDLSIDHVVFQPKDVNKSINGFIINLIMGVILVITVALIGMGWRSAIVISTALPLAIFMTFTIMYVSGLQLEQISIAGLIIALGMLVDNSIVVSDSIRSRLDQGEDRMSACVNGTKEVALPMFASLLTVLTAFTPLLMVPGPAGQFLQSLPKVVMASLIISYFISLFIIPALSYVSFPGHVEKQTKKHRFSMYAFFISLHRYAAKRKKLTTVVVIGLFTATILIQSLLGLSFFPKADKNVIYVDITTLEANDIQLTEDVVETIEGIIDHQPEVLSYTSAVGGHLPKFYLTVIRGGTSPDNAQIMMNIDLNKGERFNEKEQFVDYLQEKVDQKLAGVDAVVKEIEQGPPGGAPIQVRVTGDSLLAIKGMAETVTEKLSGVPGSVNATNNGTDMEYQYFVDINTDLATQVGLSRYDIQKQIALALNGLTSSTYRSKEDEYNLVVTANVNSVEDLESIYIKSPITGRKVPLKQVATVTLTPQLSVIHKFDRQYVIEVSGYAKSGFSPVEIQNMLEEQMKEVDKGEVMLTFAGEKADIDQNFGTAASFAFVAVSVMFIIMFIQFNSFVQPFIIFISIPLAMFGSFLGLYIFGKPLSFTVVLGIISLTGIVINNAIILTDFINREIKAGKTIAEAAAGSVKSRVRPILIGATTTIFGLVPLAFSGNSLFSPMAIALMFGILMSTALTLVVIPIFNESILGFLDTLTLRKRKKANIDKDNLSI